jgi:NADH dehydrogenase
MRILVVGATGVVGRAVCRLLAGRGHAVSGLVRGTSDPATRAWLEAAGVEIVEGDLKLPETLRQACVGQDAVVSTATALASQVADDSLEAVDRDGQAALIDAAAAAGVGRYVFVSVLGAGPDSPFARAKRETEDRVRSSGMRYTIIRPSIFMDVWLSPHVGFDWEGGQVTIYGDGSRPHAWIHSSDVASAIADAVESDAAVNAEMKVLGPESLTPDDVVAAVEQVLGRKFERTYVPVEHLEAQRVGAGHPVEQSFAGLMLRYAAGDPASASMPAIGTSTITVRDYVRSLNA